MVNIATGPSTAMAHPIAKSASRELKAPAYYKEPARPIPSRTSFGGNSCSPLFFELRAAIMHLMDLPEEDDMHVARSVGENADRIITYLHMNYPCDLPKLLPESADSLSLTWEIGQIKRYLTLSDEDIDVMHFHRGLRLKCNEPISEGGQIDFVRLASVLGNAPRTSTFSGEANVTF